MCYTSLIIKLICMNAVAIFDSSLHVNVMECVWSDTEGQDFYTDTNAFLYTIKDHGALNLELVFCSTFYIRCEILHILVTVLHKNVDFKWRQVYELRNS